MKTKALVVLLVLCGSIICAGALYGQGEGSAGWVGPMNPEFQSKWSKARLMSFEGEVVSHDVACHCFVIKGAKGSLIVQDDYAKFEQEYDRAKGLKVGENANGTYKSVGMINYAVDVYQK